MVPQFGSSLKLRYEWDSNRNTTGYIPKIPQHIPQQCIIITGWCRTGANAKLLKKTITVGFMADLSNYIKLVGG